MGFKVEEKFRIKTGIMATIVTGKQIGRAHV